MQVAAALIGLVAVATVLGLVWRASQGRVQPATGQIDGVELGSEAAKVLGGIQENGVRHVEVDIADRPDLARRYNILQTPTTLILDASGAVRARIGGAVRRDTVVAELERVLAA